MPPRLCRLILIAGAVLGLSGCFDPSPRRALPRPLIETARIPGYDNIRIWGDEVQPGFLASLRVKDRQVRDAVAAGRTLGADTAATFLAISGGGDQGAFAAGVLKGWTERGDRPSFEVVTGVSAGALGAPFAFLGPAYDDALRNVYTKLGAGELYESRGPIGYFKDAISDTSRLRATIQSYVTDAFLDRIGDGYRDGRRILILTTNLDAERPVIWDLSAIAASHQPDRRDIFIKVLLASSAIPGVFPPVFFDVVGADGRHYREMHVDGGVTAQLVFVPSETSVVPIEKEVFGTLRRRRLYVIRNGKINPEYAASTPQAVPIATRAVAALVKYEVISDLARLDRYAKANGTSFYFCAVPATFDATSTANFDIAYAVKLFEVGVKVGLESLWSTEPPFSPERFMP